MIYERKAAVSAGYHTTQTEGGLPVVTGGQPLTRCSVVEWSSWQKGLTPLRPIESSLLFHQ